MNVHAMLRYTLLPFLKGILGFWAEMIMSVPCWVQGFEQVRAIHLDKDQFAVEKDLLTPTFKLKRPQLLKHYQAHVDAMYNKGKH